MDASLNSLTEKKAQAAGYDPDGVLTVALDICEGMLENGGEIHRIEDTAERICRAYGAQRVEIFAVTSLIVATITMKDGRDSTQARRVYGISNDLSKIEKFNALSRQICRDTPDPSRVKKEISDIKSRKTYPPAVKYAGGLLGAFGFALFFGGTILDAAVAALIGTLVCIIDQMHPKYLNQIAHTVIVSAIGSLLIALFCRATASFLQIHAEMVGIAVIMLLIPGLALGNAVRDLLCGELISGAVRLLQSILVAGAIAAGFTGILFLFRTGNLYAPTSAVSPLLMIVYAGIGTLGFSLLFGVSAKKLFYAILCGMLSWSAYLVAENLLSGTNMPVVLLSSVAGGAACTFYAETMARVLKTPTTVILIPGLIPLVPGSALYYTMAFLVEQNYESFSNKGFDTLYTCIGISIGIVCVSVLFQIGKNTVLSVKKKREARFMKKIDRSHYKGSV